MYYRDWAICGEYEGEIPGWTVATSTTVAAPCPLFQQWHVDVAWLGTPVASLNLGVRPIAQ
jgi:hypothetical protein